MDHGLELISPTLEILEIEVFNILQNPGNIGKWILLIQSYPGNIGNLIFPIFPYPGNTENLMFSVFWDFYKKRRAPKFHAEWSDFRGEISHMRPIQGQKLKLFQPPILPLFFPSSKPLLLRHTLKATSKNSLKTGGLV